MDADREMITHRWSFGEPSAEFGEPSACLGSLLCVWGAQCWSFGDQPTAVRPFRLMMYFPLQGKPHPSSNNLSGCFLDTVFIKLRQCKQLNCITTMKAAELALIIPNGFPHTLCPM